MVLSHQRPHPDGLRHQPRRRRGEVPRRLPEGGILSFNPFQTIDWDGDGVFVETAIERRRRENPNLKLGVCGEHGGDPKIVAFFHEVGLDYVSCAPFRMPGARLAAAQAALEG